MPNVARNLPAESKRIERNKWFWVCQSWQIELASKARRPASEKIPKPSESQDANGVHGEHLHTSRNDRTHAKLVTSSV